MKLEAVNPNYCATVIRVPALHKLPNADRLLGLSLIGYQAIVGLDTKEGDLGLLFPPEVQLSEDFCKFNNLYDNNTLNADPEAKGYISSKRRVRAIRLRQSRSDALYLPLSCLNYLGIHDFTPFREGASFDTIDGVEICKKYEIARRPMREHNPQERDVFAQRVDERRFPEMPSVPMYFRTLPTMTIPLDERVVITQKIHGTSIRVGHVLVRRQFTFWEKLFKRLGLIQPQATEWDIAYGSHHVVKGTKMGGENQNSKHHYGTNLWVAEGSKLEHLIPRGYVIYGELIGWLDATRPIQSHYTYDLLPGTRELYVYRVAQVNPDGVSVDLTWKQVKEFCFAAGLKVVPTLWEGRLADATEEMVSSMFFDQQFYPTWPNAIPLSPDSPCDEGVCIRIEGLQANILKAKSPLFYEHETKLLDSGVEDIETTGSDETETLDGVYKLTEVTE